jgi:hypothetical protein
MLRLSPIIPALLLVGCTDQGDEGMTVLNNTAITGATCTATGDPNQPFQSHGQIYASSSLGYQLTPLIQSRISATSGMQVLEPLSRTIQLRGADISLTLKAVSVETDGAFTVTQPDTLVSQFSVLFSGSLPPSGAVNVGFDAIPPSALRQIMQQVNANPATSRINAEVLAEVTIRGDLGGSGVTSTPFYYPISVCNDCVVVNNGACPMTIAAPRPGNPCNPYQDGIVDCCTDASGNLVCPGPTQ